MFIFTQIFIIHKKKFPTSVCLVNGATNYNFAGLSFQIWLHREKLLEDRDSVCIQEDRDSVCIQNSGKSCLLLIIKHLCFLAQDSSP